MRLQKPYAPPERTYLFVSKKSKHILKFMAYSMGITMVQLIDMAIREFAARRLPAGWETEKGGEYEDFQEEQARTGVTG